MFNFKIISILSSIVFLVIGCKEPVSVKDSSSSISSQSTLNDPNLDGQPLADYFYSFEEEIDAQFLYYSLPYYDGMAYNTIQSPNSLDLDRDTLNFKTFPDYLLDITQDDANIDTRLYPLNEFNASENNWCDTLLLQYE